MKFQHLCVLKARVIYMLIKARTLIMASWQFDVSAWKEEGSYNIDGEELLMCTYCKYRGPIAGMHERLIKMPNVTEHRGRELYWAHSAQDTILPDFSKNESSKNDFSTGLITYRHNNKCMQRSELLFPFKCWNTDAKKSLNFIVLSEIADQVVRD